MIKFFRFLLGYVDFEFKKGFSEGFINECFEYGVEIQNISLTENGFTAICRIGTYKKLHRIALRHGGCVKVIKKHGLPFFLSTLKDRTGFFIGALLFVFILSFLGAFVWNIEITGCDRLSENTISAYLDNHKFKTGVMWGVIDRKSIAWDMMSDFDAIAWAHINKIDEYKLKGIKATRKEITVTAQRQQSKMSIKQSKNYYNLHFFSLNIPLYFKIKKADFETKSDKFLTIKKKELPIGCTVTNEQSINCIKFDLTNDDLVNLAKKKLSIISENELEGYEIVNTNITYDIKNDECTMTGAYVIK